MVRHSDRMIAVTIATGLDYRRMAERAASSIRLHTGLETCILGSIPQGVRPSFYRLWLFEIFSGTILWFDADTYCLADWSPQHFENQAALVAVPDTGTTFTRRWCKRPSVARSSRRTSPSLPRSTRYVMRLRLNY